jgi:hypothetical protein
MRDFIFTKSELSLHIIENCRGPSEGAGGGIFHGHIARNARKISA